MSDTVESSSKTCPDCGGPIAIRNPSGRCDHLYYPDYKAKLVSELRFRSAVQVSTPVDDPRFKPRAWRPS